MLRLHYSSKASSGISRKLACRRKTSVSRSDAKKQREPGTACGKDPSLCHGPRLTWREKPGRPSWTGTGICVSPAEREDGPMGLLPARCCSPEHTWLGWGKGRCTSAPGRRPNALASLHHPTNKSVQLAIWGVPLPPSVGRMRSPGRLPLSSLRGPTQHPRAGGERFNPAGSEHGTAAGLSILH